MKENLTILLIVLVILTAGAVFQYNQIDEGVRVVEMEEQKNWEIYKNTDLGLEFKYPKDWELVETKYIVTLYSPEEFGVRSSQGYTKQPIGLSFRVLDNDNGLSAEEWLKEKYGRDELDISVFNPEAHPKVFSVNSAEFVTINNEEMYLVKGPGIGNSIIRTYYRSNSNSVLAFSILGQSEETLLTGQEILKTVLFEEKEKEVLHNYTEDGYYINNEWGFKLMLPEGWEVDEGRVDENSINIHYGNVKAGDLIQVNLKGGGYNISINKNRDGIGFPSGKPETYQRNIAGQMVTIKGDSEPYFGGKFFLALSLTFSEDFYFFRVGSDESEDREIIYSILDTFELLETIESWNIYSNEEYGFEIQYPGDWKYLNRNGGSLTPFAVMFLDDDDYYEYGGAAYPGHYPKKSFNVVLYSEPSNHDERISAEIENAKSFEQREVMVSGKQWDVLEKISYNNNTNKDRISIKAYIEHDGYIYILESSRWADDDFANMRENFDFMFNSFNFIE